MSAAADTARDLVAFAQRTLAAAEQNLTAVEGLEVQKSIAAAINSASALPNDKAIYDVVRAMLGGHLSNENFAVLNAAIAKAQLPKPEQPAQDPADTLIQIGLTKSDFAIAAKALGGTIAQIMAVDEVESAGGGFEVSRAAILALDGPGGFIDGSYLPKILFEAKVFAEETDGIWTVSHPELSSPKWNRALYKGGIREWERLHAAMKLSRDDALRSASAGRYQILGRNHKLAGFETVDGFWAAMKRGESQHLAAFVHFVDKSRLVDEFQRISSHPADCAPFAAGYNGPGYAANRYHEKIAAAHEKWAKSGV